jgi:cysteine desulfurase family protein (TIGR01976 family)
MFDVESCRQQIPALRVVRDGLTPVFLDGPGGTQVPRRVIDAMTDYLSTCNANHGGAFATSRESDAILHGAHAAVADLLNAASPDEVVFGANMTTLTLHLSRSLAKTWRPGDEVLLTRLDHDANVTPWALAARDAGAAVRFADLRPEDCSLDLEDLRRQLSPRTRLVAVTCASNATGTVNDVAAVARLAHDAGALVFLDAVHYAPHGPVDVRDWDCDFLACSAYKFFGPHVGILFGKRRHLAELTPYKVRPASDAVPDRWMTGTQNHEGIAGVAAAVDYLADLGRRSPNCLGLSEPLQGRRLDLRAGMLAIQGYERELGARLLDGLAARRRFRVWGVTRREDLARRVPTVAITCAGRSPQEVAEFLAARQIYVWHGNMYALQLTERLGLEGQGGVVRLGLVHYNTAAEVDRVLHALDEL